MRPSNHPASPQERPHRLLREGPILGSGQPPEGAVQDKGAVPAQVSRRVALLVVAVLAVPFTVLAILQAKDAGANWDEPVYLTAGLTALQERQIRVNFEHPPLVKILAAMPASLARPVVPTGQPWWDGDQWLAQRDFVEANQAAGTFVRTVVFARLVPLAFAVGVGLLLYALAATLHGRRAGLLSAGLWYTSPFALGLSHTMTIDVPFAAATLLVAIALVHSFRSGHWTGPLVVGLACGLALLTRFTGLVLLAAAVLGLALHDRRRGLPRALLRSATVALVAWACVWGGYRAIAPSPDPLPAQVDLPTIIPGAPVETPLSARLVTAVPWPEEFDLGVGYLARVSLPPAPAYIMGMTWEGANLLYWPLSMLAKFTPGELAVLAIGLGLMVRTRRAAPEVVLAVLLPAAALALFAVVQPRPIGLRYMLPSIVLALAASSWVANREGPRVRWVLGGLAVVQLVALLSAHPHSLAWTLPPFRPAYRYVTDSNIDWTLEFRRVQEWSEGRDPWVGFIGPSGYDVGDFPGARQLIGADHSQVRGDVAVFVTSLTAHHRHELAWLRGYCPVGTIGGSVLLYHFDEPPDLHPGPTQPAGMCPGPSSRRVDSRAPLEASSPHG